MPRLRLETLFGDQPVNQFRLDSRVTGELHDLCSKRQFGSIVRVRYVHEHPAKLLQDARLLRSGHTIRGERAGDASEQAAECRTAEKSHWFISLVFEGEVSPDAAR